MRVIKFRAWVSEHNPSKEAYSMVYSDAVGGAGPLIKEFEGDPLMQFTGLKDINGVEIYEGDIVTNRHNRIAEVKFHTEDIGSCGCCYTAFEGSGFAAFDRNEEGVKLSSCTVIGNIYQNQELLSHEEVSV